MALRDIKGKIRATLRTNKVTKAMEAVSAVKMRHSQELAFSGRPYASAVLRVLARVSGSLEGTRHALAESRPVTKALFVLVTSDKGLAGSLNSSMLKTAERLFQNSGLGKENISLITLGKKGQDYFSKRGYTILNSYVNVSDEVPIDLMEEIVAETAAHFMGGRTDSVYLLYTNFKSTFEQEPVARQLFPLSTATIEEIVAGIVPERGKFAESVVEDLVQIPTYAVEPGEREVLDVLLPKLAAVALYHGLLEAKASEHSSRMVAMKNASDKSKEMAHDLSRLFNRKRQAQITSEVSEIIGGIEAMAV